MLPTGLYEQIISKALDRELAISGKRSQTSRIDKVEAAKALAKYVAEIVEKGLENVKDNGGDLNDQVDLVNQIVSTIIGETKEAAFEGLSVAERAEQLLALFDMLLLWRKDLLLWEILDTKMVLGLQFTRIYLISHCFGKNRELSL